MLTHLARFLIPGAALEHLEHLAGNGTAFGGEPAPFAAHAKLSHGLINWPVKLEVTR
jgi:hypothetical protein